MSGSEIMQSTYIEAFLAVVQTGSFSKAASQLYITQPTLTGRIQSLESELGVQLLSRKQGQRETELTDAGRSFLGTANKWSSLLNECKNFSGAKSRPSLSIAATQTLSNYIMPEVYSRLVSRDLPVTFNFNTLHFHECYNSVDSGESDIVFVSKAMAYHRVSTFPIFSEKMVLLCGRNSPYHDNIHPSELPKDKCVHLFWSVEYGAWHDYWFGTNKPPIHADNLRLVENILSTTDKWAIIPHSAASITCRDPRLTFYNISEAPPNRPIYLLTLEPRNEYTNMVTDELVSVMKDLCRDQ